VADETRKQTTRKQNSWPVAYRWMAMGTLVMYTAVGTKTVAYAGQTPEQAQGTPARKMEPHPAREFDIPPGTLDVVLAAFEQACGIKATTANEGIRRIASPGVSGTFTVDQALRKLLANTGIDFRFSGPLAITLSIKNVSASVDVNETMAALGSSSAKFTESVLDTPQTISVVPAEVLDQQGVTTLRDALRNVAGISLAAGEGGAQGDNLTIRGFTARNDLFIDGMRDFGSYYRDPFNTQEVEVLQGPSSVTFGRGSTGGVVNQESKTPQISHFLSGSVDLGTDLTRRITADVNTPVPWLGSGAAFRLNVMGDENNVAGRDVAENRRFGVAPSLALGLGTPTRWTFSYIHQSADDNPDYGIPWLFNGPAPVNRNNYYGFEKGNFLRTYDDIGTVKVEHDFSSHFTLRNQVRYANYVRDVQITEPQVLSPSLSTPLSALLVNRNQIAVNSTETNFAEQLDLTSRFKTGWMEHTLVSGIEAGRETSDPVRPKYTNVPTTSLLDPDPSQVFTGIANPSTNVHTTARSQSVYALDTVKVGSHLELTGGIRWDRFATDYTQSVPPVAAFSRVDEQPTWRAAVTYKPVQAGSIYFAAGTSFNPSAEGLSLSAANANLPPEKNRTLEAGTKWDLSGGRLSIRTAVFRTDKTNAREPDPNNPLLNVLAGNQRVNGLQAEIRGHVTSRWEILSSYAYLDGKLVSSQFYPAAIGAQLANVPRNTFNIWNTYRFPKRWEAGLGANYVSSRTASSTVPYDPITGLVKEVPGYWVFNAMLEHPLTEHISLQVNGYNLANRYYYDELHPGHIVLGPGRSALVGVKFKF
jgi:catecholate siderophore receptor